MQVTTSQSGEKGARTITLEMPCGNTVAECIKMDGEEIVHNYFSGQKKVAFQAGVRRLLKEDKADKEINAKMSEWKPGLKKPGKSAVEKATDAWGKLSDTERKALLAEMRK
jgi:hypothetical protein